MSRRVAQRKASGRPFCHDGAVPTSNMTTVATPNMLWITQRELIVIVDDRGRSNLEESFTIGAVRIIDCDDVAELSAIGDDPVLIDIDLHDPTKIKKIKDNLPDRTGNLCTIIAVDRGNHLGVVQAKSLGASDVLARPLNRRELANCLRRHGTDVSKRFDPYALSQEPGGTSIASAAIELNRMFKRFVSGHSLDLASVARSGDQVVDAVSEVGLAQWLNTVRRYHESTFQHCLVVTGILTTFGRETGMRRSDILTLTIAGLLHDIGKAQVPVHILDKPGALTEEEFTWIKRHPVTGFEYLQTQRSISAEVLNAVRHHHEYLDGSGYPDGLLARDIDDLTRIVTVCDIYGALVEQRAYKAPKSRDAAMDILIGMAGQGKIECELVMRTTQAAARRLAR